MPEEIWRKVSELKNKNEQLRAEIKALKERIELAIDYLPECPDKAKSFLLPVPKSE